MQGFVKMRVPLADIRPSGQNPRHDFGDIDALAETIRATGGEPLNPPVLVADGNVYRIVDGERRYRALCRIYGEGSGREVSALVTEGMDDANELVAMLATDDKRQLTDAERARGVQQMLVLGVDEVKAARAARATTAQVRAVRAVGRVEAEVQPTLAQYECAAGFEDEADREAVLSAGSRWENEAWQIRRRIEGEQAEAADRTILEGEGVGTPEEAPEGWRQVSFVNKGDVARRGVNPEWGGERVLVDRGTWWAVYAPASAGAPTEEEVAEARDLERERLALADLKVRAVAFAIGKRSWSGAEADVLLGRIRDDVRGVPWDCRQGLPDADREALVDWVGDQAPARWECALAAIGCASHMAFLRGGGMHGVTPKSWLDAWHSLKLVGFPFEAEDAWVRGRVVAMAEAGEAE